MIVTGEDVVLLRRCKMATKGLSVSSIIDEKLKNGVENRKDLLILFETCYHSLVSVIDIDLEVRLSSRIKSLMKTF